MDVELAKHKIQQEINATMSYIKMLVRMNDAERHYAGFRNAEDIIKAIKIRFEKQELVIQSIESQIQE